MTWIASSSPKSTLNNYVEIYNIIQHILHYLIAILLCKYIYNISSTLVANASSLFLCI